MGLKMDEKYVNKLIIANVKLQTNIISLCITYTYLLGRYRRIR